MNADRMNQNNGMNMNGGNQSHYGNPQYHTGEMNPNQNQQHPGMNGGENSQRWVNEHGAPWNQQAGAAGGMYGMDLGKFGGKGQSSDHRYTEGDKEHEKMDIKEYFKHEFPEEIEGCNKYCDLAKKAEEKGDRKLAYGLYEMGKDEYTHAKFIHDYLIEWGCEIPDHQASRFRQTKERVERLLRQS